MRIITAYSDRAFYKNIRITGLPKGSTMTRLLKITVLAVLASTLAIPAMANDKEVINRQCKPEPENQCAFGELRNANLAGKDLHDGNYDTARLDGANLSGANLSGSSMQVANLTKANLSKANLERVHLHAAQLMGADLSGANLTSATMTKAFAMGANFKGANLTKALLQGADFSGATWTDGRTCADGSIGGCK
ncbi:pentapeptide repeat-containing protein [Magnetospirillum sp. SS-4]|uniref:pentapeptide repeat-containing protein n=1 Tax=Magnetospirillum sp. SS-4 TaxID=2681465 RepID=UPI0015718E99|nr:pentapeptide repeat-containing protein [Magnetospirillum sp. SS-4]